jgi:WD40 repeat protein
VTGTRSADASVRLFDHRKLSASNSQGTPIEQFEGHTAAVLCVQWCPDRASVFGSCAEDGLLNVWDFEKASNSLFSLSFLCPIQINSFLQILHQETSLISHVWSKCR